MNMECILKLFLKSALAFSFCFSFTELQLETVSKAFHITTIYTKVNKLHLKKAEIIKNGNLNLTNIVVKQKKCKVCGKEFNPFKTTDRLCSYICGKAFEEQQEIDKRFKSIQDKVKERDSLKLLMKAAKQIVQKYARLRDKYLPCISCGTYTSTMWDGGHMYKSELYSGVRLDEININKQCRKCNTYLSGNEVGYVKGFIAKYGLDEFNKLSDRATLTKNKKWSVEEIKEIITSYKLKIKDLV